MEVLLELMIKIIWMVGLGVLLKKTRVITKDLQKGLSNLLVTAVLPLNIIASANQELTGSSVRGAFITACFSFIYYVSSIVFLSVLSKHIQTNQKRRNLIVTMGVFANTGFIGFPLVEELYGSGGIIYAVIYNLFYQLFFYTYGMYLISPKQQTKVAGLLSLFKTPVTIASFTSIAVFLLQIHLPAPIQGAFQTVGNMTVPLSMIIIGCMVSEMRVKDVLKDKSSYLVTFFRLAAFPAIAYLVLKAIHIDSMAAGICVLITGLPSGSLNVIIAEQENCEPEFAAGTVVQSMIFMILSLPVLFLFTLHR